MVQLVPRRWTSILTLLVSSACLIKAATLQQLNVSLANNPTNVGFYIYVPDTLAPDPPILVNPHWCHGDAPSAYVDSTFANLSSEYGFIIIYPDSPNQVDKCWDVSSTETLTHNGGGDSLGIVSMVNWTLNAYNGDPGRVFVTGVSSGAMMTNVLVGAYPDVLRAGVHSPVSHSVASGRTSRPMRVMSTTGTLRALLDKSNTPLKTGLRSSGARTQGMGTSGDPRCRYSTARWTRC